MTHDETIDHRRVVAGLSAETRRQLVEKSDLRGLVQLGAHWGLIAILALAVAARVPLWPLIILPLGILIMFQFTALHEATHGTAFRSPWLNSVMTHVSGTLVMVPPEWFRFFHLAHHRHTQDPDHDPELAAKKPQTQAQYFLHLSGVTVWRSGMAVLIRNAAGRADYPYVPQRRLPRLATEARLMLAFYIACIAASAWLQSLLLVWIWLVPALLGQPFLRAYLLAEHTRCPLVANMLENSRTTFTTALVRFVAWNMPYHAEHHAYPTVPFWKLPALHGLVKEQLRTTEKGYVRFHRKLVGSFGGAARHVGPPG